MSTQEFVKVTPPGRTTRTTSLPPDILQRASQRLAAASLVYALAYFFAFLPGVLFPDPAMPIESLGIFPFLTAGVFIVGSVGVFFAVRRIRVHPETLLDLGLVYEVVAALGIEIHVLLYWEHLAATMGDPRSVGISWVCVWMVVFPLIVPSTPGKTFLAATASASMRPLMLLIVAARGGTMPSTSILIEWLWPAYICVGIAVAASRVVYRMTTEVSEARKMGSYRLVEMLGVGGMGEVWRAEHRMLARPAAVKLIRPEAVGSQRGPRASTVMRRFEREAQATAGLSSPHTIQLHDFGVADDGTFYYVMELLRGLDLDAFVTRFGPMQPARIVYVLQQACASLGEAHERGLVHRDVKPANVYLCRVGREHDFVKLLDFGLVKSTTQDAETQLTAHDVAAGTPAFMAPEVALGLREIDGRADVYALGCVAYWLLTGTHVFTGANAMRIVYAHVNSEPVPPSQRTELIIPPALEATVMACLQKDREARPQTADELALSLARSVADDGAWTAAAAAVWWKTHLPELVT